MTETHKRIRRIKALSGSDSWRKCDTTSRSQIHKNNIFRGKAEFFLYKKGRHVNFNGLHQHCIAYSSLGVISFLSHGCDTNFLTISQYCTYMPFFLYNPLTLSKFKPQTHLSQVECLDDEVQYDWNMSVTAS